MNCRSVFSGRHKLLRYLRKNAGQRQDLADPARIALEGMESYCAAHPDSPSALHHPSLKQRDGLWIALLGPNVGEGIVGLGDSVEAALRAFDVRYTVKVWNV